MNFECLSKCLICVPTFNGGALWREVATRIKLQVENRARVLVIDSSSTDGSDKVALECGFELHRIKKEDFDHGGTRQKAFSFARTEEFIVFLTQDSLPIDDAIVTLLSAFDSASVAMAYGRQLPKSGAGPIEAHARLFNYPSASVVKTIGSIPSLGIKTAFCSNSFAAYDIAAVEKIGGFSDNLLFGEDMHLAARFILQGYTVKYVGDAMCKHSHSYTIFQDFQRSFDIGAFHTMNSWILREFGAATGEGLRFFRSEMAYILKSAPHLCFSVFFRTLAKYIGYQLGKKYKFFKPKFRSSLGMNKNYWGRAVRTV